MRILALDFGPEWRGGQVQTLLVSTGLAARGHDVTVGAVDGSPLHARAAAANLPVVPIPAGGQASPRVLLRLSRAVRSVRPDVLWAGDARAHGAAVWSRASRDVPLVVHRRVLADPRRRFLSRVKYALADRFLVVSRPVKDVLLSLGVAASRIAIVADGLPPEAFVEARAPEPPPFHLVHAGAFDGRKGQGLVVEVLARLVGEGLDARATFLGEGLARSGVEERARRLGVVDRCSFPGRVDDVAARLSASHLLLLPSDSEGAPLVLLEAMAAGCPTLAHDVGGIGELTRGGACGRLVPSLDPAAWTSATRELLLDAPARAALAAAGRAATADRTAARTARLVEAELIGVARAR